MIARIEIERGAVVRAGLLPLHIGRDAVPRLPARGHPDHAAVVEYLSAVTEEAGLNARYRIGDAMVELEVAA
jgi:poly-gamma-glutamate synthesis protein (capsule biosynthesis protein)